MAWDGGVGVGGEGAEGVCVDYAPSRGAGQGIKKTVWHDGTRELVFGTWEWRPHGASGPSPGLALAEPGAGAL